MDNFLTLLIWIAFGAASAHFAKKQNRNPVIWFFIGLFLGIFGLLLLLILPLIQRLKASRQRQSSLPLGKVWSEKKEESPSLIEIDPSLKSTLWYYLDKERTQQGPMSFNALAIAKNEGKLSSATFIWSELLPDWKPFQEVFPHSTTNTIK
ncbi:MAG: DUF4339 domain-containing protein [Chlamydiae bacterium]|nr:DUF4339 domain-containing protein [Chlamydiota bacterium]